MRKLLVFIVITIFLTAKVHSQDFSNKGVDFWLPYPGHIDATVSRMALYISSDQNAVGEVRLDGKVIPFTVTANQATTVQISPVTYNVYNSGSDAIGAKKGIQVVADKPIVLYAHVLNAARSGSTIVFPTNVLGRDYISINSKQSNNGATAKSQITIVAVEDATTVEINPKAASIGGKPANTPFTVSLNKGDVYQYQSLSDLTGSTIRSAAQVGGCKPIAVFTGSTWTAFDCNNASGGDNLYQQLFPLGAWGKNYVTAPFINRNYDIYRIIVKDVSTKVMLNGVQLNPNSIIAGSYYEFSNNIPNVITSDLPILVVQYMTSQSCNSSNIGDPEIVILNPIEQTINNVTVVSARNDLTPPNTNISQHYINVIMKTSAIGGLKIDNATPTASWVNIGSSGFSYLQQNVTTSTIGNPSHNIKADSGFIAIAYGVGNVESYAYNAGTNVKDFSFPTITTLFGQSERPSAVCIGTPFTLSVPLSFQPTSIKWTFSSNPSSPTINPNATIGPYTNINHPTPVNGLYSYSPLDANGSIIQFSYNNLGKDTIKLITANPAPDGCNVADQEYLIPIDVFAKPKSDFTVATDRCIGSAIQFTDATTDLNGSKIINGIWLFGDGGGSTTQMNPTRTFLNPNFYQVKYVPISSYGCAGDTVTKTVEISSIPIPKFGISDTTCVNKSITFIDSSTIAVGTIVKWYWDYGNGVKDTVNSNVSRTQTYATGGLKTVSLIVENNTGCKSIAFTKSFFVGAYPNVNFGFPTVICLPNAITNFSDSTLFTDNIVTNATYSWNFGDGGIDSIKNPIHKYNTVGPFNVQLQVASQYGCVSSTSKVLNTIYAQPKAKFLVSPEVCLRDSTSFIDSSDGMGATVAQWRWNFGDGSAINTTQNPKHLFTSIGTKAVQLFVLTSVGCFSDTLSLTTVVNPLPVSDFTFTASFYCEQRPVDFVSTSSSSVSTIQRWNWQMGDGRSIDTINGNQFSHTYAAYKSYTVGLMVENAKGCKSDTVKKVVTVYPLPQVGFIVPEICLADASAQFMDTSKIADGTENQFTYSWNLNASNITPTISNVSALNIKNPSAKYNKSDVYSIQSTVTSNRGCAVSKTQLFTVNGSIPVSKFSVLQPTMLCSNDTVRIQDISTVDFGNITRVEIYWDYINQPSVKEVDDNPTSKDGISGKIYSHQYSNFQQPPLSKTYQVRFVAYSGGNSCVSSSEQIITVHAAPQVRFTTLPGICNDTTSRMITQASEVSNISGSYAFSGVGVNSVGVFNPRAVASGTYPIQYKYTSVAGCSDSATQNITVWPSPTAKWGISDTTCERNSFRITDSSVANYSNINRWEWNYGNGSTSIKNSGQPYLYQYATANIYNVSLRVITDSGCRSTYNSQVVRIHPLPQISFTLPNICLPDGNGTFTSTSSIADNSDALFRYRWNFNDPNDATGGTSKIQQHRYTALAPTGGYAVQLKIESKDNCIDSLTQQFTKVYPQPKTAFDIRDTSVCMGDTIYFTDRTDGKSSTVQQWYWNLAQGNTARVQNPQRAFKDSGVYTISLYSYNGEGCVSDTVSQTVVVHPYPQLELGKNLFVLEGGTITLQPQFYYGKQLSYRWTPNLYLNSDTVLAPQSTPAIFLDSIIYKLTLTGIGGCAVSDSLVLTILHPPKVPNAFSPNGDGINDTWQIKYIDSYPGAEVSVFNRYGQMVYQVTGYRNSTGWNGNTKSGEALPVGTYYYIINPKNGRQPINGSVTIIR